MRKMEKSRVRYRYKVKGVDLTIEDLKDEPHFRFKYGKSMRDCDVETVEYRWKHKLGVRP